MSTRTRVWLVAGLRTAPTPTDRPMVRDDLMRTWEPGSDNPLAYPRWPPPCHVARPAHPIRPGGGGPVSIYLDLRDWWIGYYRSENHHYVCLGDEHHAVPYQVCFECEQVYATATDLLDAWNDALADSDLEPESDVERVVTCPKCVHDFLYPPVPHEEVTGR